MCASSDSGGSRQFGRFIRVPADSPASPFGGRSLVTGRRVSGGFRDPRGWSDLGALRGWGGVKTVRAIHPRAKAASRPPALERGRSEMWRDERVGERGKPGLWGGGQPGLLGSGGNQGWRGANGALGKGATRASGQGGNQGFSGVGATRALGRGANRALQRPGLREKPNSHAQ